MTGEKVANYTKATRHDRELLRWLRKCYPDATSDNAAMKNLCDEVGMSHKTAQRMFKESKAVPWIRALVLYYLETQAKWKA